MIEEKIPVKISGKTYEILGSPSDVLYINSLAQYVEKKMKEIEDHTNIVNTDRIAVLAALNIADELFREKENKNSSGKSVDKKHEELIRILNDALAEPFAPLQ